MPLSLRIDPWTPAYESAIRFEDDPDDDPPTEGVAPLAKTRRAS